MVLYCIVHECIYISCDVWCQIILVVYDIMSHEYSDIKPSYHTNIVICCQLVRCDICTWYWWCFGITHKRYSQIWYHLGYSITALDTFLSLGLIGLFPITSSVVIWTDKRCWPLITILGVKDTSVVISSNLKVAQFASILCIY